MGNVRRKSPYRNQYITWDSNKRLVSKGKNNRGYIKVNLNVDGKAYIRYVHRLVAKEFCANAGYKEVNHIDGNKENNVYTNLEWCSRTTNLKHMYDVLGAKRIKGFCGRKKKVAQIEVRDNTICRLFDSVELAANSINSRPANISACCGCKDHPEKYKKAVKTVKGYKWMYATDDMKVGDVVD